MNLGFLLMLGTGGMLVLWLVQTGLLLAAREPWRCAPLRHRCQKPLVRCGIKLALQAMLLTLLVGYPLLIGENPLEYHRARLQPANWWLLGSVLLTTFLCFCPLIALYFALGWVQFDPRRSATRLAVTVVRRALSPLPLAFVEEALFRGVIQDALLHSLTGRIGGVVAILLGAVVFASVHFFRPQKRLLVPAIGLFTLGVILGTAYTLSGHSYWLPAGMHAGGVLFIQVSRPFLRYKGPSWLIGCSSYPISGLFGVTALALYGMAVALWLNGGMV